MPPRYKYIFPVCRQRHAEVFKSDMDTFVDWVSYPPESAHWEYYPWLPNVLTSLWICQNYVINPSNWTWYSWSYLPQNTGFFQTWSGLQWDTEYYAEWGSNAAWRQLYISQFKFAVPAIPSDCTFLYARINEVTEEYNFGTVQYEYVGFQETVVEELSEGDYIYAPLTTTYAIGEFTPPWVEPPIPPVYGHPERLVCRSERLRRITVSMVLVCVYKDSIDEPDCDNIYVTDITDTSARFVSAKSGSWLYDTEPGTYPYHSDADGIVTGLTPDTIYWAQQPSRCSKKFYFTTLKEDDWDAYIITLEPWAVWSIGATICGRLDYTGNSTHYLYLGFQYGLSSANIANQPITWLYSGNYTQGHYAIQMTINGLLPDRTYYYRACLHKGTPPMNVDNYFGDTLDFGGPRSVLGEGTEYVTAKQAEDDISRPSSGRYYMDKNGQFIYESYQHRLA